MIPGSTNTHSTARLNTNNTIQGISFAPTLRLANSIAKASLALVGRVDYLH